MPTQQPQRDPDEGTGMNEETLYRVVEEEHPTPHLAIRKQRFFTHGRGWKEQRAYFVLNHGWRETPEQAVAAHEDKLTAEVRDAERRLRDFMAWRHTQDTLGAGVSETFFEGHDKFTDEHRRLMYKAQRRKDGYKSWNFKITPAGHSRVAYARTEDEAREQIYERFPSARGQRVKIWSTDKVWEPPW